MNTVNLADSKLTWGHPKHTWHNTYWNQTNPSWAYICNG